MLTNVLMVLIFAGGLPVSPVSGLRWSPRLMSNKVKVCSGQNIQLFWNFTLDRAERLKGMVWDCQSEGKKEEILATYVDDHFVPMSTFSGRLAHLEEGGIELSCATILESGKYSIAVTTENAFNRMTVHRKSVNVNVVDTPKTQSGNLHVSKDEEAVRDVTSTWHVQLSCGNFTDRGHPPVGVTWTTPDGLRLDSSSFQDGIFHLLVPNPVVEGNYTCSIPPSQAAAQCLSADSPLLDTVSVYVEENAARFSLLEARQQELLDKLTAENQRLLNVFEGISNRTDDLEERLDKVQQLSMPVSFHARLTGNTQLSSGSTLKLPKVISNQGQGYSRTTGYFTAPVNGTYFFIGTTGSYSSGNWANMYMMKGGTEVARTYLLLYSNYYSMGSCHVTLYLKAGERVWLQSSTSNSYFYGSVTSFSGFRI